MCFLVSVLSLSLIKHSRCLCFPCFCSQDSCHGLFVKAERTQKFSTCNSQDGFHCICMWYRFRPGILNQWKATANFIEFSFGKIKACTLHLSTHIQYMIICCIWHITLWPGVSVLFYLFFVNSGMRLKMWSS